MLWKLCRDGLPEFTATVDFAQKIPAPPKDERVVSGDLLKRGDGVHNLAGGRIFMPCGLPCHREFNGKARGIQWEFDSQKGNSAFWSFRIMYYLLHGQHRQPAQSSPIIILLRAYRVVWPSLNAGSRRFRSHHQLGLEFYKEVCFAGCLLC